ncbi:nuclease [Brachionus plicatilis]|uniref:Nuclease n=1 Tax=Brachionus plicatilis TaxID=10195 RepID=A0A3M7R4K0_BRAPC|nr:nuclease [Brachionus plicatilis]
MLFEIVTKVYDGDTITALNASAGSFFRIRFKCIDAPEMNQIPWGKISQKRLNQIIPADSYVQLKNISFDTYGRTLAEVFTDGGENVNEKMIREGFSCYYFFQKGCEYYKYLERLAKAEKLNFWNDFDFTMPWKLKLPCYYRNINIEKLIIIFLKIYSTNLTVNLTKEYSGRIELISKQKNQDKQVGILQNFKIFYVELDRVGRNNNGLTWIHSEKNK